jgi:hypothetical protein
MREIAVIALAISFLSSGVSAQTAKLGQGDLEGCTRTYVNKYVRLCEAADIVARGVANACAPRPPPLLGRNKEDHGQQVGYELELAIHEQAYARALVAVLDARAADPASQCSRMRPGGL